ASDIVVETLALDRNEDILQAIPRATIRCGNGSPRPFSIAQRRTVHIRHRHKYSDVALPRERRFYFRTADGHSLPPAATMREFGT
ncbi:HAD family hydrolase, partial [Mycobacterium sp. ITM-2017-0098]